MPTKKKPGPVLPDDPQLAHFQATLLDLLSRGLTPQQVIDHLQRDPQLADFQAYIATFEPRMVEVAIELVQKWGRKGHDGTV